MIMLPDEPTGAYDTGGSGFDATRDADAPVSSDAAAASRQSPAASPPPAKASAGAVPQASWDRAVGAWLDSHVRSSPVTQGASGAWEHLNNVLPRLRELLERELRS